MQFATAEAPSVDAVREFLLERAEVDVVALVQCTSPFIQPRFLAEGHNSVDKLVCFLARKTALGAILER